MRIQIALLITTVAWCSWCGGSASAGLIVTFGSTNPSPILAGTSGTLDVFVHSDSNDVLDGFVAEFLISPTGLSAIGGTRFSVAQLDAQLSDPIYVFSGRSLSLITGASVGTVNAAGDQYIGFDATDDGSGIPLAGNPLPVTLTATDLLLFRLNLDGVTAGSYQIEMTSAIFFIDQLGDLLDPLNHVSFTSTPGAITVTGAAAVPEPSTAALLGLGLAVVGIRRRMRRGAPA